jgi:hypothetical protein
MPSHGRADLSRHRGTPSAQANHVASPAIKFGPVVCLLLATQIASGQNTAPFGVNPYGYALAQNSAIEQSRLYRTAAPRTVDAYGNALPAPSTAPAADDSFGAQEILKNQEPTREWTLSGAASLLYTDNVELSSSGRSDDVFAVVDAGLGWSRKLNRTVEANVSFRASIFRYDKNPALDFQNLGFGAGVAWTLPQLPGASVFARYDFTQLFDRDGDSILTDHAFTIGLQKAVAFSRGHGLTLGIAATIGISDPHAAQRDTLAAFIGYRLQLTQKLETDLLLRPALHYYNSGSRVEFNQILAWNFRYRMTDWAELNGFLSYGLNRSERAAFDYNVFTTGIGFGVTVRF